MIGDIFDLVNLDVMTRVIGLAKKCRIEGLSISALIWML
jgi:hypothetical protein